LTIPNNPVIVTKDDSSTDEGESNSKFISCLDYLDNGGHQQWLQQAGHIRHEHYCSWEIECCDEDELPEGAVSLALYRDFVLDKITFSKDGIMKLTNDFRFQANHRLWSELGGKDPVDRDVPPRLLALDVLPG
jgi:hypothetical protein